MRSDILAALGYLQRDGLSLANDIGIYGQFDDTVWSGGERAYLGVVDEHTGITVVLWAEGNAHGGNLAAVGLHAI